MMADTTARPPWVRLALTIAESVVMTLLVFLLLHTFVGRTYAVQQLSMEPTLEPDQRLIIDRLTPTFDPYKPGDIIVFEAPDRTSRAEPFIKRVIATAGSTVELVDGKVLVDGVTVEEPYVLAGEATLPSGAGSRWLVPKGHLFVLGDNRSFSVDSRSFGPIPTSSVIGRAWLRFYPFEEAALLSVARSP